MASFLLSECLEEIFSNLIEYPSNGINTSVSIKDLYSCTLVSRHWCRISSPSLYSYPFHHLRHRKFSYIHYYKLIRTLLSCIPQFEIEQIYNMENFINKSNSNILSTFNYISFIRGLIFHKIMFESQMTCDSYNKEIWLSAYNTKSISEESTIDIMKQLLTFICKNCNNLTILEFSFPLRNDNYIIEIFKDCNEKSKLSNLKELYYTSAINYISQHDNNFFPSNNVYYLNLLYVNIAGLSTENINLLSQFISSQKKLQHFVLSKIEITETVNQHTSALAWNFNNLLDNFKNYENLINSLSTQSESLQILEFMNLELNIINKQVLNSLCLLKNIRKLKIYRCDKINDLHFWVKNLKKLEVFEIVISGFSIITKSTLIQLIQLIQSFSSNLTKLVITYIRRINNLTQLYQQIPIYLHSLIHLELPTISTSELISIFKSCTKLVYLKVLLLDDKLSEEILRNLGKFAPKTLKRIHFRKLLGHSKIPLQLMNFFLEENKSVQIMVGD
ncbi:hypothetical protein C1645_815614 [Glomus cerebriforme]|uniref:Uncharacterized protein n=1 Tax=Glomus cerebriforme TaxID=658196 RepID=A0A397TN38_9GLOM|nr:hypothetical protein C1645_815614 [Glomus cerebriforme]